MGTHHFNQIQQLIWDVRSSYKKLGYCLGLSYASVESIQQSSHDADDSFHGILNEALKMGLSRNKLAKVLESKTLGYGYLAQKVRAANFCELFCILAVCVG